MIKVMIMNKNKDNFIDDDNNKRLIYFKSYIF